MVLSTLLRRSIPLPSHSISSTPPFIPLAGPLSREKERRLGEREREKRRRRFSPNRETDAKMLSLLLQPVFLPRSSAVVLNPPFARALRRRWHTGKFMQSITEPATSRIESSVVPLSFRFDHLGFFAFASFKTRGGRVSGHEMRGVMDGAALTDGFSANIRLVGIRRFWRRVNISIALRSNSPTDIHRRRNFSARSVRFSPSDSCILGKPQDRPAVVRFQSMHRFAWQSITAGTRNTRTRGTRQLIK